jgi:hypothetical protein
MDQGKNPPPPDDKPVDKPARKPYVSPKLVRHGSVRELSLGRASAFNDSKVGFVLPK